jgi:hypothetical protein
MSLIEQDETVLIQYGIITPRTYSDRSGVTNLSTARLSDSGVKISKLIETYDADVPNSTP